MEDCLASTGNSSGYGYCGGTVWSRHILLKKTERTPTLLYGRVIALSAATSPVFAA